MPLETAAPITRPGLEQDSEYHLSNAQVKNFERQWEEGPVLLGRGSEELGLGWVTMRERRDLSGPGLLIRKTEPRMPASPGVFVHSQQEPVNCRRSGTCSTLCSGCTAHQPLLGRQISAQPPLPSLPPFLSSFL